MLCWWDPNTDPITMGERELQVMRRSVDGHVFT